MSYQKILKLLNFSNLANLENADIIFDEVVGLQIPFFDGLGFPPALVPLANSIGSPSYFGAYIYDVLDPKFTFVDFMVDEMEMFEIGLNEKQFCFSLAKRAMQDYFEEDSDIVADFSHFCTLLGVGNSRDLILMTDENFLSLDIFKLGIPKYFITHKAGTTFGSTGFDLVSNGAAAPSNLTFSFDLAFNSGNYQNAWDILNSPGWSLDDSKIKFKLLVDAIDNDLMSNLFIAWANINHPKEGY